MGIGSIISPTTSPMLSLLLFMAESIKSEAIFKTPIHFSKYNKMYEL